MNDYFDFVDTHLAGDFDARWDGFEDQSDWEYHMQQDDREDDGWSERYDYADDFGGEDAYIDAHEALDYDPWSGAFEMEVPF